MHTSAHPPIRAPPQHLIELYLSLSLVRSLTDTLYGSHGTTAKQGPAFQQPWGVNEVVGIGGVAVRPGDYVIGDCDGVVVVPSSVAEEVADVAEEREVIEGVIKDELMRKPTSPGHYYPFKAPITPASPLGRLLAKHTGHSGVRGLHTTHAKRTGGTMRAAVVRQHGGLDTIEGSNNYPTPALAPGGVLVRNHVAGLNFIDT